MVFLQTIALPIQSVILCTSFNNLEVSQNQSLKDIYQVNQENQQMINNSNDLKGRNLIWLSIIIPVVTVPSLLIGLGFYIRYKRHQEINKIQDFDTTT